MSDTDLILIYKHFEEIDRELKQLRKEVGDMKWYQQHGTTGAVAYSSNNLAQGQVVIELDNGIYNCQDVTPHCVDGGYCKCEERRTNNERTSK